MKNTFFRILLFVCIVVVMIYNLSVISSNDTAKTTLAISKVNAHTLPEWMLGINPYPEWLYSTRFWEETKSPITCEITYIHVTYFNASGTIVATAKVTKIADIQAAVSVSYSSYSSYTNKSTINGELIGCRLVQSGETSCYPYNPCNI